MGERKFVNMNLSLSLYIYIKRVYEGFLQRIRVLDKSGEWSVLGPQVPK